MKIVVIGGVAAGLKSAAKARRCDPGADITVIEKGSLVSYGACGLPYYVAGDVDDIEDLMKTPAGVVRTVEYFSDYKDIKVLSCTLATRINRKDKTVSVTNLNTNVESLIPYDRLVIATGASPLKPELPGIDLQNVFNLWHPDDAAAIRRGFEQRKFSKAVIIGAGLVGVEMTEALKIWIKDITLVEREEQILSGFLDSEIAGMAEKYIRNEGVRLLTGENVVKFEGDTFVTSVVTDKRTIPADLVILAMGVRPNVELAAAAGLVIGKTGAVEVNRYMQTSDTEIYAGGDCVENVNIISGKKVFAPMGSTANKHGRIIGENLFGNRVQFKGILNTVIVKFLDLKTGKTGITEREAKELGMDYISVITAGHDKPHYMEDAKLISIKLIADVKSRKILGMQATGEGDISKRIDVAASLLTTGGTIDDLFDIDLSYAPPFNGPIDNAAVAANALMNKLDGKFRGISPSEARVLMNDPKTVFLDVRTPTEYKQARLTDSRDIKHIPLGELRNRLSELNRDDEIVAFCKISLRGYEAEGILEGENFKNVRVIEGGLFLWPFME